MDEKNSPQQAVLKTTEQLPVSDALAPSEDFRITHPKAISSVFRQLMSRKNFLTVECSNHPHPIVTRILAVDENAGLFIYEGSAEQLDKQCLLGSEENYFAATQDGIRVQFVSGRSEQHEFEGALAFRAQLPESLYRMQRRQFFRAAAPLVETYRCTVNLPDSLLTFIIYDLSLNGVGLRSKDPTLGGLPIGTLLSKAVLDCRMNGMIETDLQITNLRYIQDQIDPIYHLGCRFQNLPRAKEPELQRLITYLELGRRGRRDSGSVQE